MSYSEPSIYPDKVLKIAENYKNSAKEVYGALNFSRFRISSNAILGGIWEELNLRYGSDYQTFEQSVGDNASSLRLWTHDGIKREYDEIRRMSPEERLEIKGVAEKVWDYPTMIDVGPGNFQVYTAVRLIEDYFKHYGNSDPLKLSKYKNDYVQLTNDLNDFDSDATVKLSALMAEEAVGWAHKNLSNWRDLPPLEREAFVTTYYRIGQDKMNQYLAENRPQGGIGEYVFRPHRFTIAKRYMQNVEAMNRTQAAEVLGQKLRGAGGAIKTALGNRSRRKCSPPNSGSASQLRRTYFLRNRPRPPMHR